MESNGKTLADAGEYEFIKRIRKMMPEDGGEIVRSAGDDCLVTESFGDELLLNTTDTFVEGIHFKRDYSMFALTGSRCMAASVSDIAAMSGIPVYTLVSLSLPPDILFEDAVNLFSGLQSAAEFYGCPVAGGETTSTNGPVSITVTVIGRVERDRVILRSGAGEGDLLYVTGCIGDAMAGLMAFDRNEIGYQCLKDKFLSPEAHIMLSRSLTESYHITSMIDMSDGLATDISNICQESCCGADIRSITEKYEIDTTEFALTSGEDFALLFTSDDENISEKFQLMNHTVTRIGSIVEHSRGIRLHCKNDDVKTVLAKGYEHFKS